VREITMAGIALAAGALGYLIGLCANVKETVDNVMAKTVRAEPGRETRSLE
jgi:hypothetical protein